MPCPAALCLLVLALPAGPPADPAAAAVRAREELNAFWAEATRTVREGDFAGYATLYHLDGVFVSDIKGMTAPIADQLTIWKPGFEATKRGETVADVEFRLTARLIGSTTAHETGIFRYVSGPPGESGEVYYIHFEALTVRGADGWRWVMERQLKAATVEEWTAARAPR